MDEDIKTNSAIVFPEIIGVSLVAITTPYYLFGLFEKGHIVVSGIGLFLWILGVYFTVGFFRKKNYILAWLPMLLILGIGYLTHIYLI